MKIKNLILLAIVSLFLFGSCGITKKKCDGGKKMNSPMW